MPIGHRTTKTKATMKLEMEKTMGPIEYLEKPYGRLLVPESDGTFRGEILEFPGCIAVGDTPSEALAMLEEVAASWLEASLAKGQRIPEPMESIEFSGKLVLRLPKSLHKKAAHAAEREGVSLNQFIVSSDSGYQGLQRAHANTATDLPVPAPWVRGVRLFVERRQRLSFQDADELLTS